MATWFRFDKDFDWRARPRVFKAYKQGQTLFVTDPCAEAAEAAGAGVRVNKPKDTEEAAQPKEAAKAPKVSDAG